MSEGKIPEDWNETKKLLNIPAAERNPENKGEPIWIWYRSRRTTWLRHQDGSQGALIDCMILEGTHSKEDIYRELKKIGCGDTQKELGSHVDHLTTKSGKYFTGKDLEPHRCEVGEVQGKMRFVYERL